MPALPGSAHARGDDAGPEFMPAAGSFTPGEFQALYVRYDWRCLACATTGCPLTVDHVVPLARGGSNAIANIQPLCGSCNSRKRSRTIDFRTAGLMFSWCKGARPTA